MNKRCTRCRRALPLDAFGLVRDDRTWRKSKCRERAAELQRERRAKRAAS